MISAQRSRAADPHGEHCGRADKISEQTVTVSIDIPPPRSVARPKCDTDDNGAHLRRLARRNNASIAPPAGGSFFQQLSFHP